MCDVIKAFRVRLAFLVSCKTDDYWVFEKSFGWENDGENSV